VISCSGASVVSPETAAAVQALLQCHDNPLSTDHARRHSEAVANLEPYVDRMGSGLPPQEAPIMTAEKRKLFFSFVVLIAWQTSTVSHPRSTGVSLANMQACRFPMRSERRWTPEL